MLTQWGRTMSSWPEIQISNSRQADGQGGEEEQGDQDRAELGDADDHVGVMAGFGAMRVESSIWP